ncbi:MAG: hypothetical protein Q8N21_02890 [bacterium]|nr:hypothetical protein [bacterium]
MFFWQDLGKFLWMLCRAVIIFAALAFFSLAVYYRPDIHVRNVFQLLQNLKTAKTSIHEKIEKTADENKKLNKEIQILKREKNELKEKNQNVEKQINEIDERLKALEKLEESKKEEKKE